MPRDIPVGNGQILVNFDRNYQVRDVYFPHVGKENQAGRNPCRLGVWADGEFSWIGPEWDISMNYRPNTLVTDVVARSDKLSLELNFSDCVDYDTPIFVREIRVKDLRGQDRQVRLFFHYDFNLYDNPVRDTVSYSSDLRGVIHYKDRRYILINTATPDRFGVDQYAVGEKAAPDREGTWRDAEDGELSGNAIATGMVDSTVSIHLDVERNGERVCFQWLTFGYDYSEIKAYNSLVWQESPAELIRRTHNYWMMWVNKEEMDLSELPDSVRHQFIRSLLIARAHTDVDGAIIAGADSDASHEDLDTYSYVFPREAAVTALGFDSAGYPDIVRSFFLFCAAAQSEQGFMFPKYHPDGTVGSMNHAWVRDGHAVLPIQADQTGIILFGLWEHFRRYRDVEFIDPMYETLIISAAEFLADHVDEHTHLPIATYGPWGDRMAVHTYTTCATITGLWSAAKFARAFGNVDLAKKYNGVADRMKNALVQHFYNEEHGRFARAGYRTDEGYDLDMTMDVRLLALPGVFPPDDERVMRTVEQVREHLMIHTDIGGYARFQHDQFRRATSDTPNAWILATLWIAKWDIHRARNVDELREALPLLEWVCERALPSGVLPEQVHPHTGEPISVSPSTISHGMFAHEVMRYLEKLEMLEPGRTHRRNIHEDMNVYKMAHIPGGGRRTEEYVEVL